MARWLPDFLTQGASLRRRSCSLHRLCSTRTYSSLEVHHNVHTSALSFSRQSASGATSSSHLHAAAGETGRDQSSIRSLSPTTVGAPERAPFSRA
jgi:hypothetical protein